MSKLASVVTAVVCLGALGACTVNTPAPAPASVVVTPPPPTVATPGSTVVVPSSRY